LWTWKWTIGFHKKRWIFRLAGWLLTSKEGLCFMDLISIQLTKSLHKGKMRNRVTDEWRNVSEESLELYAYKMKNKIKMLRRGFRGMSAWERHFELN
jgi:hypothetical protein